MCKDKRGEMETSKLLLNFLAYRAGMEGKGLNDIQLSERFAEKYKSALEAESLRIKEDVAFYVKLAMNAEHGKQGARVTRVVNPRNDWQEMRWLREIRFLWELVDDVKAIPLPPDEAANFPELIRQAILSRLRLLQIR